MLFRSDVQEDGVRLPLATLSASLMSTLRTSTDLNKTLQFVFQLWPGLDLSLSAADVQQTTQATATLTQQASLEYQIVIAPPFSELVSLLGGLFSELRLCTT